MDAIKCTVGLTVAFIVTKETGATRPTKIVGKVSFTMHVQETVTVVHAKNVLDHVHSEHQ